MKIRKNNRLRGGRQGVTPAPSVKKEIAKSRGRAFALMEWGWNQDSLLQRGRRVRVEDRCAAIVLHSSILSHSGEVCITARRFLSPRPVRARMKVSPSASGSPSRSGRGKGLGCTNPAPLIIRLARSAAGEAAPKERVRVILRAIQDSASALNQDRSYA